MIQPTQCDLIVFWADDILPVWRDVIQAKVTQAAGGRSLVFTQDLAQIREAGGAHVMVVLDDPNVSLARRIAADGSTESALTGWLDWAGTLLAVIRKNRRGVTMVDLGSFFEPAMPQAAILRERTGLAGLETSAPAQGLLQPSAMAMVAAFGLLALEAPAQALAAEIRSMTLASARPVLAPAVISRMFAEAQAQAQAQRTKEAEEQLAEQQRLRTEAEVAWLREAASLNSRLLDETWTALNANRAANAQLLGSLQQQLDEVRRRCALLGAVLLADSGRIAQLDHDLGEKRHRIEALEQELKRVYSSKSWKVTSPIRRARNRFSSE